MPEPKPCDVCGKEFVPPSSWQKRCGPECTKAANRERRRERYATDPVYRARERERDRERVRVRERRRDPEYLERERERDRERRRDPEYLERRRAYYRERRRDPEYLERERERVRRYRSSFRQFQLVIFLSKLAEKLNGLVNTQHAAATGHGRADGQPQGGATDLS